MRKKRSEKPMKIIISPAKKMEECQDIFEPGGLPEYIARTELLYRILSSMSESELQNIFQANDQITRQNFERYQTMDIHRAQTPALLSYVGIQYQYMAPKLFSYGQWEYAKAHLRILSGFYGILRPQDRVTPYRLEMQTKLSADGAKDLYRFWGRTLYDSLVSDAKNDGAEGETIINLASKEYSKSIEPYLTENDHYVTCVFGVLVNGKVKVKATEAKMARGEMVRYMAEKNVQGTEELKQFDRLEYRYSEEHSDANTYVFIKVSGSDKRNREKENQDV